MAVWAETVCTPEVTAEHVCVIPLQKKCLLMNFILMTHRTKTRIVFFPTESTKHAETVMCKLEQKPDGGEPYHGRIGSGRGLGTAPSIKAA